MLPNDEPLPKRRKDDMWSIDHKIPLAMIFTLFFQLGVAIWWGSKLDSRITTLEFAATQQTVVEQNRNANIDNIKERVVRTEMAIQNISESMKSSSEKLDRILDGMFRKSSR